jgi:periplasmic copper chaperone A
MVSRQAVQTLVLSGLIGLLAVACTVPEPPRAQPALTGDAVRVEDPMARPSPMTTGNGAAYMKVVNPTEQADQLVSATSPAAAVVELHETVNDDGVMRMVPQLDGFAVPARSVVELKPGGKHVMFIDLVEPWVAGEEIQVTLHFQVAGDIQVTVPVVAMDAPAHSEGH